MQAFEDFGVIFVTDITGFSKTISRLGTQGVQEVVQKQEEIKRKIQEYGGEVIKSTGDGYLAVFKDIRKALDCAKGISKMKIRVGDSYLKVRVALHTGQFARVKTEDGNIDIFGADVNLAFRLCDALESGIAITENALLTAKLNNALSDVRFRYSGRFKIKGFRDSVKVFVHQGRFKETEDVKKAIRYASYWKRATAFYLDVLIFTTTLGIITTLLTRYVFKITVKYEKTSEVEHAKGERKKLVEPKEVIEFKVPGAQIEAGGGKLEIKTPKGEIETRFGKIVVRKEGKEVAKIDYLRLSGVQLIVFMFYLAFFWWATRGQSPGKWLVQLRVRKEDGTSPNLPTCLIRAFLLIVLVIPAGLGIIVPVLLKQKLPHDSLTKTYVEDVS